jgi:hypothetical protein
MREMSKGGSGCTGSSPAAPTPLAPGSSSAVLHGTAQPSTPTHVSPGTTAPPGPLPAVGERVRLGADGAGFARLVTEHAICDSPGDPEHGQPGFWVEGVPWLLFAAEEGKVWQRAPALPVPAAPAGGEVPYLCMGCVDVDRGRPTFVAPENHGVGPDGEPCRNHGRRVPPAPALPVPAAPAGGEVPALVCTECGDPLPPAFASGTHGTVCSDDCYDVRQERLADGLPPTFDPASRTDAVGGEVPPTFEASTDGPCVYCTEPVNAGDDVVPQGEGTVAHVRCDAEVSERADPPSGSTKGGEVPPALKTAGAWCSADPCAVCGRRLGAHAYETNDGRIVCGLRDCAPPAEIRRCTAEISDVDDDGEPLPPQPCDANLGPDLVCAVCKGQRCYTHCRSVDHLPGGQTIGAGGLQGPGFRVEWKAVRLRSDELGVETFRGEIRKVAPDGAISLIMQDGAATAELILASLRELAEAAAALRTPERFEKPRFEKPTVTPLGTAPPLADAVRAFLAAYDADDQFSGDDAREADAAEVENRAALALRAALVLAERRAPVEDRGDQTCSEADLFDPEDWQGVDPADAARALRVPRAGDQVSRTVRSVLAHETEALVHAWERCWQEFSELAAMNPRAVARCKVLHDAMVASLLSRIGGAL